MKAGIDYLIINKRDEVLALPPSFFSLFKNSRDSEFVSIFKDDLQGMVESKHLRSFIFTTLDKKTPIGYCTLRLNTLTKDQFPEARQNTVGIDYHKNTLHIEHFAKNTDFDFQGKKAARLIDAVLTWCVASNLSPILTCSPKVSRLADYYIGELKFVAAKPGSHKVLILKL